MNKYIQDKLKEFEERTNDEVVENTLLITYDLGDGEKIETYPESRTEIDYTKLKDFLQKALEDIYQRGVDEGRAESDDTLKTATEVNIKHGEHPVIQSRAYQKGKEDMEKELTNLLKQQEQEIARVTAEEVIEKISASLQASVSSQLYDVYANYDEDIATNIRNNMRKIARGIRRVKSTMNNMLSGKYQKKPLTYLKPHSCLEKKLSPKERSTR